MRSILANPPNAAHRFDDLPPTHFVELVVVLSVGVGNSSNDPVCGKSSGSKGCDVVVDGDSGPVLPQDCPAIRVDLAEGDGAHSCSFKSKAKSSYARKQIKYPHDSSAFLI